MDKGGKTEAQRGEVTCPRSRIRLVTEQGTEWTSPDSQPSVLSLDNTASHLSCILPQTLTLPTLLSPSYLRGHLTNQYKNLPPHCATSDLLPVSPRIVSEPSSFCTASEPDLKVPLPESLQTFPWSLIASPQLCSLPNFSNSVRLPSGEQYPEQDGPSWVSKSNNLGSVPVLSVYWKTKIGWFRALIITVGLSCFSCLSHCLTTLNPATLRPISAA